MRAKIATLSPASQNHANMLGNAEMTLTITCVNAALAGPARIATKMLMTVPTTHVRMVAPVQTRALTHTNANVSQGGPGTTAMSTSTTAVITRARMMDYVMIQAPTPSAASVIRIIMAQHVRTSTMTAQGKKGALAAANAQMLSVLRAAYQLSSVSAMLAGLAKAARKMLMTVIQTRVRMVVLAKTRV